jgi:PAS domain-containing protein
MQLARAPKRTLIYNDAHPPMPGVRHQSALGRPFDEVWPDVWPDVAPLVDRVFQGKTIRFDDLPLTMTRHGYPEETWWTFSCSPIRDEAGDIVGLRNVPHRNADFRHRFRVLTGSVKDRG